MISEKLGVTVFKSTALERCYNEKNCYIFFAESIFIFLRNGEL